MGRSPASPLSDPSQNSVIRVYQPRSPPSPSRSPVKHHTHNFRRDLQVTLDWASPEFEDDYKMLKIFLRSLVTKYFSLERTGREQSQEATRKVRKAILEKYPDLFGGYGNADKLEEAIRFVKGEHTSRRARLNRKERENRERRKKRRIRDDTPEDSDSDSRPEEALLPAKTPQKAKRVVKFGACPSTSLVSQRPTGTVRVVDIPDESISRPLAPPRDESRAPKRERPSEAERQVLMEFLQTCTPSMDAWYEPLVAFGCDNMTVLEDLACWDDTSLKEAIRTVKDQLGVGEKLKEVDVLFLFRNLRKKFQARG